MQPVPPLIRFKITLSPQGKSEWPFRDQKINLEWENSVQNPHFSVIQDNSGFLIIKSLHKDTESLFAKLKQLNLQTIQPPLLNIPYMLIFYDASKQIIVVSKDTIGLSSVLYTEGPFCISSYGINGKEIPPGVNIFTQSSICTFKPPPYKTNRDQNITVDQAMDMLQEALVKATDPNATVLFSGGLDSTVLAAAQALAGAKEVNLVNFCANENAPDYSSAQQSHKDLVAAFPNTKFNFIQEVGKIEDLVKIGPSIIQNVIPLDKTEMNLNIAMTLYNGLIRSPTSTVLSGLGPDELFCGYMSMKNTEDVDKEVCVYINRLWERNGGRDDRIANQAGKFVIAPYMSREFLDVALKIPREYLLKAELGRGEGEKWILRQLAERLGLHSAAKRPKQAMQFGSKVAKAKWNNEN